MDSSTTAKRILEWKPVVSRRTGRTRIRWLDDVCKKMVLAWNDLVEKSKNPQRVIKLIEGEEGRRYFYRADKQGLFPRHNSCSLLSSSRPCFQRLVLGAFGVVAVDVD
jgi:hypothetical protein